MQKTSCMAAVLLTLALLSNKAVAQTTIPQSCAASASVSVTSDLLNIQGAWYEIARNPYSNLYSCVQLNLTYYNNNNTMGITSTFSTPNQLSTNQTMYASVPYGTNSASGGYNISFTLGDQSTPYAVYKILQYDPNNYAYICGYTNYTDNASSFGIILTREQNPNSTYLSNLESIASATYTNFLNGTMPLITQSEACYTGAASTAAPLLGALLAALYVVMKLVN